MTYQEKAFPNKMENQENIMNPKCYSNQINHNWQEDGTISFTLYQEKKQPYHDHILYGAKEILIVLTRKWTKNLFNVNFGTSSKDANQDMRS